MPSPKSPVRPFPKASNPEPPDEEDHEPLVNHRAAMIGSRGVGKAALVSQFMTSEGINAYDRQNGKNLSMHLPATVRFHTLNFIRLKSSTDELK
jgi:hypothetical protein